MLSLTYIKWIKVFHCITFNFHISHPEPWTNLVWGSKSTFYFSCRTMSINEVFFSIANYNVSNRIIMGRLTFVMIFLLHRDYDNLQIIFFFTSNDRSSRGEEKNDSPITSRSSTMDVDNCPLFDANKLYNFRFPIKSIYCLPSFYSLLLISHVYSAIENTYSLWFFFFTKTQAAEAAANWRSSTKREKNVAFNHFIAGWQ